jgi:hypothetical protein
VRALFETLDRLEPHLYRHRYLCGDRPHREPIGGSSRRSCGSTPSITTISSVMCPPHRLSEFMGLHARALPVPRRRGDVDLEDIRSTTTAARPRESHGGGRRSGPRLTEEDVHAASRT